MTTSKQPSGVRKLPVQPRSTARHTRVLNACGELVNDIGYDAVTTTLIAQRARVAIGSIYQFFTDKKGVMTALAARHLKVLLDNTAAVFDTRLGGTVPTLESEVITAFCDEAIDSYRNEPGCRALRFGAGIPDLGGPHPHDTITDHLLRLMPPSATDDRGAVRLAVETALALIDTAFRDNNDGNQRVLDAARDISVTVLSEYLP